MQSNLTRRAMLATTAAAAAAVPAVAAPAVHDPLLDLWAEWQRLEAERGACCARASAAHEAGAPSAEWLAIERSQEPFAEAQSDIEDEILERPAVSLDGLAVKVWLILDHADISMCDYLFDAENVRDMTPAELLARLYQGDVS